MIEVLRIGTKNQVECFYCGSLLSYSQTDVIEKETYLSQRNTYLSKYIICPVCGNEIILEGQR